MFISKVFSLFFVCILAVCGNSVSQTENIKPEPQTSNTELSLSMKRSHCYGTCPVYELNIQSDGKVLFNGIDYTETKGEVTGSLSNEKMKQLVSEIEKANFYSYEDSYTNDLGSCSLIATDNPTVTLSVKLNGKEKNITHYLGCRSEINSSGGSADSIFPLQLYNLENKIDEIVETKRWIGKGK
ncbi:MAG TPA: DUF6438 domain-containing protein [Pyrinomonadaceae bacterium]|jgi:hypothetical protein